MTESSKFTIASVVYLMYKLCAIASVCKVPLTPSALTWSSQCGLALGLQSEIQPLGTGVCLGVFADHCLRNSTCPDSTKPPMLVWAEALCAPTMNVKDDMAVMNRQAAQL